VVQQRDVGPVDKTGEDNARQVFARIAGSDGEVDAYELQTILNTIFMRGQPLNFDPTLISDLLV